MPDDGDWAVKRERSRSPLSSHRTKAVAEVAAVRVRKRDEVDVVYHKRDGTIHDCDSYGNDPYQLKDRKY